VTSTAACSEPGADREALIDRCAADATRQLALPPGEFLPFAAGWPQVRKGYLAWVREHEARGVQFAAAEEDKLLPLDRSRSRAASTASTSWRTGGAW